MSRARDSVDLQLAGQLVLLHFEIIAGKIEIYAVVIGPDMAVQPAIGADELERGRAELLGQDDRAAPEFLIGEIVAAGIVFEKVGGRESRW